MKISKKILGVAMAIIMILNVFAVGVFAAVPANTVVDLTLSTDKAVYAAGEEVTITVYEQVIPEAGQMTIGGCYEFGYNSAVIAPISTGTDLVADQAFVAEPSIAHGFDNATSQAIHSDVLVGNAMSQVNADGAANYGWDSIMAFSVAEAAGVERETIAFDADAAPVQLFTFKMKIADDAADGTYTIGFNRDGYDMYNAYSNDLANMGLYGTYAPDMGFSVDNMYAYGTCTFTVGDASPVVYPVKRQIQWADKDANTVNLGIVSGFDVDDIEIAFNDEGTSTNVKAVGATVTFEGADPQTKYERFVYAADETKSAYHFRAVLTNIPADYSGTITIAPFVMMTNGDTYEAEVITIDAATFASYVGVLNA